jgi:DNA polymerase-3 subunit delta
MKIDARALAKALARPDPALRAFLVHGPDDGLVRERAAALARTVAPDLADPFRVADLTGAMLASDPRRLADEAAAISMLGGRRVVRVRPAGNEAAPALAAFLKAPAGDALIVVEAGELDGRSALRKLFDAAANAGAIACYHDEARDLPQVIVETLARHQIRASADAIQFLAQRLGNDRAVTRAELDKLALYVGAGTEVTLDDARACVGDMAEIGLDDLVRATATGDAAALERALARLAAEGVQPVGWLRAAQRHFQRLHVARALIDSGEDDTSAMARLRPPVFWKDEAPFRAALRRWSAPALARALRALLAAELLCKSTGQPADLIASDALLALAARR